MTGSDRNDPIMLTVRLEIRRRELHLDSLDDLDRLRERKLDRERDNSPVRTRFPQR